MADDLTTRASAIPGLSTLDLRDRLASGALRAVEVAGALLRRIAEVEPNVQAWAWLDSDYVMAEAQRLDQLRLSGRPIGPLHGMPVGIKDVIDTRGIPTANGTPLDAGRVPREDAAAVERLRAAGALIMGKTETAELAFLHPPRTRNPANPAHTPGGSSSGSAAAVASGMVPLAVGTQTGGSVIRPAAFCGTVGFKPSFGMISRRGVLSQSPTLDTIGVFARDIEGAALLCDVLFGHDPADRASVMMAPPRLLSTASAPPPVRPMLAMIAPPRMDELASEDTKLALDELVDILGEGAFGAPLPSIFDEAATIRERINYAEMAKNFYSYEKRGRDQLSDELRAAMDEGKAVPARDYLAALDWVDVLYAGLDEILSRCDALLTPAAPGAAPEGLGSTGDSIFNGLWTLLGMPAVTIPVFEASSGLPMGLQLVGRRGDDARLLRTAAWLMAKLTGAAEAKE
ncbi:MAG: amidase [Paracoccus sp. (in: a-proteobacteria)]|nr:amidase [Paracoccus sp. (in: a-proteobacteria)]